MRKVMRNPAKIFLPLLLAACCVSAPAIGGTKPFLDQLSALMESARDPLDKLYLDLTLDYALCGEAFRKANLLRNTSRENETISEAKQCQTDKLVVGNAAIEKIRASLQKPGAQTALKDLTLYWRVQLSEVDNSHGEGANLAMLRILRTYAERVRLEAEW
jgi:hypothetical protein